MPVTLSELPNEILYQVFLCLPAESIPVLQQISWRFNELAQPILWRHFCQTSFKYWSPKHCMEEKFQGNVNHTNWKKIFLERQKLDRYVNEQIDSLIGTQSGRIPKATDIRRLDYDTKDALLRHCMVDESAEDVLARRYYSNAVLGSLHRSVAIRQWVKLNKSEDVPLERALGCFDMFMLRDGLGDLDFISGRLDEIARDFVRENPEHQEMSIRRKSKALAEYLRARDLVGIKRNADTNYHNLQNNFIGMALQDADHPSLPLISVAIYCGVARRLSLEAYPCGFPFHVLAIVKPSEGIDLDGGKGSLKQVSPIFMDPFRSSAETSIEEMRSQLMSLGVNAENHEKYLDAASTIEIVHRCAKNIINSVQAALQRRNGPPIPSPGYMLDTDGAFYGALWALALLSNPDGGNPPRPTVLPHIIERAERLYTFDVALMEEHLSPLFHEVTEQGHLMRSMVVIRESDMPKEPKRRTTHIRKQVRYKVGQCFVHHRYNYYAVITGWDPECLAGDAWISRMRVNELSRGKHQSFYHVLAEDGSVRYVAEDNIKIVETSPSENLKAMAGAHFKRWDDEEKVFINNMQEQYPDD